MSDLLSENRVSIGYSKRFNSYYIDIKNSLQASQDIYYCPWCGSKLPEDITDLYYLEISKALNIDIEELDLLNEEVQKKLPKEFKTDEWWRKRGL